MSKIFTLGSTVFNHRTLNKTNAESISIMEKCFNAGADDGLV